MLTLYDWRLAASFGCAHHSISHYYLEAHLHFLSYSQVKKKQYIIKSEWKFQCEPYKTSRDCMCSITTQTICQHMEIFISQNTWRSMNTEYTNQHILPCDLWDVFARQNVWCYIVPSKEWWLLAFRDNKRYTHYLTTRNGEQGRGKQEM